MPYKLSSEGRKAAASSLYEDMTEMQEQAIKYLHKTNRYIHAAEIAEYYGYPNGMYCRGVLSSLEKKGLLLKKED